MHIDAAARTHVGRRPNNEDAFLVEPELGLYVVADGMGGYEGGEVASRLVIESLREFFARNVRDGEATWPTGVDPTLSYEENLLRAGIEQSHREVIVKRHGRLAQMGATVVALALCDGRAVLAHVGDSRIYRLRDGALEQMTEDHSLANAFRAMHGGPTPPAISHVVTRAIGMPTEAKPDLRREACRPGDVFLLCSDGVTDPLDEAAIAVALGQPTADAAATELVELAYASGGSDNITAIVLRIGVAPDQSSSPAGSNP